MESKVIRLSQYTVKALDDYRKARVDQIKKSSGEDWSQYFLSMTDDELIRIIFY